MTEDFSTIERPYDMNLDRSVNNTQNGNLETQPVKDSGSMGDVWVTNFIKSDTWQPRSFGFYLDGRTGYAEFTNVYISGEITAVTGTIGGWTIAATELSNGNIHLKSTAEQILLGSATAPGTGTGIFIGLSAAAYQLRAGNPAGAYMLWDGSALSIVGGTITAGTIQSAASGTRFLMTNATQRFEGINPNGDVVGTFNWSGVGTTTAVFALTPVHNARPSLEIIIPSSFAGSGAASDAKAITISNAAASICINITDGGTIALQIAACDTSAINVTTAPTNGPGLDLTYSAGDYPVIDLEQAGTATNSYGIRITQGTAALKEGIYITSTANSNLAECIYLSRSGNSASDIHAMVIESANAGAGSAVGINLSFSGMNAFTVSADATAEGAYAGRFPIRVGGATKYVSYNAS